MRIKFFGLTRVFLQPIAEDDLDALFCKVSYQRLDIR